MRDTFESAGLRTIEAGILVQQVAATYAAYADRIAAGGDSVLVQLDPLEFEAGLKALRAHAAHVDPTAVTEPIDFFVFANSATDQFCVIDATTDAVPSGQTGESISGSKTSSNSDSAVRSHRSNLPGGTGDGLTNLFRV